MNWASDAAARRRFPNHPNQFFSALVTLSAEEIERTDFCPFRSRGLVSSSVAKYALTSPMSLCSAVKCSSSSLFDVN